MPQVQAPDGASVRWDLHGVRDATMSWSIRHSDSMVLLPELPPDSIGSCVTDQQGSLF